MRARFTTRVRAAASAALAVALVLGVAGASQGAASNLPFRPGLLPALHNGARITLGGIEEAGLREPAALAAGPLAEAGYTTALPTSAPAPAAAGPLLLDAASFRLSTLSEPLPLDASAPYVVGLTWEGEAAIRAEARYFRDGSWQSWEELSSDERGGDRPGTESLHGSEPYILTGVDAIQVRAYTVAGAPIALDVHVYSSDVTADDRALTEAIASAPAPDNTRLVDVPQPPIRGREEWEARAPTDWFQSTPVGGAAVHHTAGVNDYSRAEVPAILRSIQNLHMNTREFWDIGYNFLIDRYGVIWEGRAGGIDATARGAHSHTFNPRVTGVSIMGNFQQVKVPSVAVDSLVALLAWKLTLHGASADGILLHEGVWPAIIGHKDIPESSTSCPGIWLYQLLPEIRARVTAAQHLPEAPLAADVTGDGVADIVTVVGDTVVVHGSGFEVDPAAATPSVLNVSVSTDQLGVGPDPSAPFEGIEVVATFDVDYDIVTAGPSLTGGPGTDIIARERLGGLVVRIPQDATGAFGAPVPLMSAAYADFILSPGDVTGDGLPDIVIANAEWGLVVAHPGDGTGKLGEGVSALPAVGKLSALGTAGDVNHDGNPDLALVLEDGGLLAVVLGDGMGQFSEPIVLAPEWAGFDGIASAGDLNGDGIGDLIASRSADGVIRTLLAPADGLRGTFVEWERPVLALRSPMAGRSWTEEGSTTLLALDASGRSLIRPLLPPPPRVDVAPATTYLFGQGVRDAFVIGDVDANGLADVATLGQDGALLLHLSTGQGFEAPIVVADPGDNLVYEMLPGRPLYLPLPTAPEPEAPLPGDLPVTPPVQPDSHLRALETVPDDGPFWAEYTSVAGAGDIDFDGTPDLVAVTKSGDVLVFAWDAADPSRVAEGVLVAKGLGGYRVVGVGPWRPGSISDLVAVSADGDVVVISGRGLTGAHVGAPVDRGWQAGDRFEAVGQVGPGVRPVVVVVGPDGETAEAYAWSAEGDWTLVSSTND